MAKYRVTGPDGATYEVMAPDGATDAEVMAYVRSNQPKPQPAQAAPSAADDVGAVEAFAIGTGRAFDKVLQGAKQVGYWATGNNAAAEAQKADEADKDARYSKLSDRRPIATTLGEIGAIAASLPISGGATLPATMARFAAAGAVPGLVSYGTPEERLASGALGAAGGAVAPWALNKAAGAASNLFGPKTSGAKALASAVRMAPDELAAKVRAGNVEIVPGIGPSLPQAAMDPNVSQLWRTMETLPGHGAQLSDFLGGQDAARKAAIASRVGQPIGSNIAEAADNASSAIMQAAKANKAAAKAAASAKFKAVDPTRESAVQLPLDEINAALNDVFGTPGSRKPAGDLPSLVEDIRNLASPTDPKVTAKLQRGTVDRSTDSLADAIRKWGGLNVPEGAGELRWLRESDLGKSGHPLGPFARRKGGMTFEQAAEKAAEAGYLDGFDQRQLLEKLMEEARGNMQFAGDGALSRMATDGPVGDKPRMAVTWETLQALRSRAGDIVAEAGRTGTNKAEATVAARVRDALDATMERVASGRPFTEAAGFSENFTPAMQKAAREAVADWRKFKTEFDSGPAQKIGRYGADGKPQLDGGEAVRAFVNSKATQRPDAEQLLKVLPDPKDFDARQAARGFVVSDLLDKAAPAGRELSPAAFNRFMEQRGQMVDTLFPEFKAQALRQVQEDLNRAAKARDLSRVKGSDTAQKLQGLSALDSPWVDRAIGFVPTQTARAILSGITNAAKSGSREKMAQEIVPLLMDPTLALTQLERLALLQRGLLAGPATTTAGALGAATGSGLLSN